MECWNDGILGIKNEKIIDSFSSLNPSFQYSILLPFHVVYSIIPIFLKNTLMDNDVQKSGAFRGKRFDFPPFFY